MIFSLFFSATNLPEVCNSLILAGRHRHLSDDIALEDERITIRTLEGACQLIAIGKDNDVRCRLGRALGPSCRCLLEKYARNQAQDEQAVPLTQPEEEGLVVYAHPLKIAHLESGYGRES